MIKCYYCGKVIERFSEQVEKKIPMAIRNGGIRNYRRQFHFDCLPKFIEGLEDWDLRRSENNDWDAVYQYFRTHILGISETIPLQQHEIKRLKGLRLGQYYPSGNNTIILPRGYSFPVILVTLKVVRPKLTSYLSTTNFANHKHKIDGIMRFVTGEINDVYKRMEMQKKSNDKLSQDEVKPTQKVDYTASLKRKEKKDTIKSSVDTGGLL